MLKPHWLSPLLAALCASSLASEFIADIEYAQVDGHSLLLDVCIPDGEGPFPIAMLVHGGGWTGGDKRGADKPNSSADISPWFQPLTDAGYVWFSINYRLAPESPWPASRDDTLTALRWVNENAAKYQGDPTQVAVFGHSTGGALATLTAIADPEIRPEVIVLCAAITDFESDSDRRGGLSASLQALFHLPQEITPSARKTLQETSPINLLQPDMPAFLILSGTKDTVVPIKQSYTLRDRLNILNTPCELIEIPEARHRLTEWSQYDEKWQLKMISSLKTLLETAKPPSNSTETSEPRN